jgi:L-asparaginase II
MIWHMTQTDQTAAVLVEVTRGGLVESRHRGHISVVDGDGREIAVLGETRERTYFRSAAKPFQTIPIIESGAASRFGLTPVELAVITGSHSGEAIHLDAVRGILDRLGFDAEALQCGAHLPFDEASTRGMRARGEAATALHNNCSGKHAGMLLLSRHLDAPIDTYLDPEHPVQQRIRAVIAAFAGVAPDSIGVSIDGCSAPVFAVSIAEMARSYARLVSAGDLIEMEAGLRRAAGEVVAAMIAHPEMVGGTSGRLDTDLMRESRGAVISKVGAEGVQLLGVLPCPRHPRGLGIAIKIEDGDIRRARDPVVIETLRQLGVIDDKAAGRLGRYARATLYNYRRIEVGEVRPAFQL